MTAVLLLGSIGLATTMAMPQARRWDWTSLERAAHRIMHSAPRSIVASRSGASVTVGTVPVPENTVVAQALDERLSGRPASEVGSSLLPVTPDGFIALPPVAEVKSTVGEDTLERAAFPLAAGPSAPVSPELGAELGSAHQAIALYRKGLTAQGDEFAKTVSDPVLRVALEWVAIRFDPREAGLERIAAFAASHPDWPMTPWLARRVEELSVSATRDPAAIAARFSGAKPLTLFGRLAWARTQVALGNPLEAAVIVRAIWRDADIDGSEEAAILGEFGPLIGRDDHKYRADRLLYKEQVQPALRAAALAGPDVKLLALARASVTNQASGAASDAAIAAVPKPLANDPGLLFSRIQKARRAGRITEAADLMAGATRDPALLIGGDEWWVERRLIARKLLDAGDPRRAYALCAGHSAASDASTIEAEFHAGWIALRFLADPKTAAVHFARAAANAETPISRARVAYWQGRAAETSGDQDGAARWFGIAASQSISFYGQLAAARIGVATLDLHQPKQATAGGDRREAIRIVEQLYGLGERDIALPLAMAIAKTELSDSQIVALADVLTRANDAKGTLLVGKLATQRGLAVDETAFPTFGVPSYQPLTNSADRAVVYAIARQESEFDPRSASAAGAKGLMQLIASTARQTAQKLGVAYTDAKLVNDTAFNAQIGAAHLGQLLSEQRGSYILTFAAYNAGSQRVKEWIDAYGDPRKPGVDPVDWIERIPFTETRNYVQRVFENLQIYRSRFGQSPTLLAEADLAQRRKGT